MSNLCRKMTIKSIHFFFVWIQHFWGPHLNHPIMVIFIPRHTTVVGYYGFTLDVRVSVCPSVRQSYVRISFPDDNLSKHQWIFTKLGPCIDIVEIWFGIANGQIRQILTELSARDTPIFSFPDDNLTKHLWISTKLGIALILWRPGLGLLMGKFCKILDGVICPRHAHISFPDDNFSKCRF